MNAQDWMDLDRLFAEGLELGEEARREWLARQRVSDAVRAELLGMFEVDGSGQGVSDTIGSLMSEALDAPFAGLRLGSWRLLAEIGQGGMGYVYLAERVEAQFQQLAAVKLIRGRPDPDASAMLRRERQILAELQHPNIARLIDGGETRSGQPYIVMEYIQGEPVLRAAADRRLTLDARVRIVAHLASAVHYAHQRLVIHRDIKPENVLLRPDGTPVLLDFGIARLLDAESRTITPTEPSCTPAYASPEQRNGEPLGTPTDVYSLGLLLFELISDSPPVLSQDGDLLLPRSTPALLRRRSAGELFKIVARAAASDPQRRYESAQAMAHDLQRFLAGQPVLAVSDSLAYRGAKLLRRHPYASALVGVLSVLLAFFMVKQAQDHARALRAELSAQQQASAAEAVTAYLVALFREVEPTGSTPGPDTPLALVGRGVQELRDSRQIPLTQRVRLLGAFGEIYTNLGQPELASSVLREAESLSGGLDLEIRARLWEQIARAADSRMRFNEAQEYFGSAAKVWRGRHEAAGLARALVGLGLAQARGGDREGALASLREALEVQTRAQGEHAVDSLRYSIILESIAGPGADGSDAAAIERAVRMLRRRLPPDDPQLLSALGFYGMYLRDSGRSDEAETLFIDILKQRKSVLRQDSQLIALVHNNLGRLYYDRGQTLNAITHFRAAIEDGARSGSEHDPSRAVEFLNLASLYEEVGDYDRAEPLMRAGYEILSDHPEAGMQLVYARQNLGRLLLLASKYEEALPLLTHPIPPGDDEDHRIERLRQQIHLAEWNRRTGSVQAARQALVEAKRLLGQWPTPPLSRIAAHERIEGLLAAGEGDLERGRERLESARTHLEQARSRTYVGVGELTLDIGELHLRAGDVGRATQEVARAATILESQLAADSPQLRRLAELQRRLKIP